MDNIKVIIGLGNPGSKYDNTKHNIGFDVIDYISHQYNISINKVKFKSIIGEGKIDGERVILVKPQTYMNLSGESVREIIEWYKLPVGNIIIIFDDIDLNMGKIRVRPKGSAGSHNGMKSVIYQIQDDNFPRIRIGIGRPPEGWDLADYVLSKFGADDRKIMDESVKNAAKAVEIIIKSGVDSAMNLINK